MIVLTPALNQYFKENPDKITIDKLNNFKFIFPAFRAKGSFIEVAYANSDAKFSQKNELNSNFRFHQTMAEFLNVIYTITRKLGFNPEENLSDEQLLEIMQYTLKNTDYTYFDLYQ